MPRCPASPPRPHHIRAQKQHTRRHDRTRHHRKHLQPKRQHAASLPPTLATPRNPNASHPNTREGTIHQTHNLRLPPALHQRLLPVEARHRLDVIRKAARQAREGEEPEDEAEGQRDALLDGARARLEVEGDDDGDGDDGEVDA